MPTYSIPTDRSASKLTPPAQQVASRTNIISMATTDLVLNATFDICRVPAGARVLDVILAFTDMDTNASPTLAFHVGDSGNASRFINAAAAGSAGTARAGNNVTSSANFAAHTPYANETLIFGTVSTAAATAAAGTIRATVLYTCE